MKMIKNWKKFNESKSDLGTVPFDSEDLVEIKKILGEVKIDDYHLGESSLEITKKIQNPDISIEITLSKKSDGYSYVDNKGHDLSSPTIDKCIASIRAILSPLNIQTIKIDQLCKDGKTDEVLKLVSGDINFESAFVMRKAIQYGNLDMVKKIVDKGGDVSIRRFMPIRTACEWGKVDILEFLLNCLDDTYPDMSELMKWATNSDLMVGSSSPNTTRKESLKVKIAIQDIYQEKGWD